MNTEHPFEGQLKTLVTMLQGVYDFAETLHPDMSAIKITVQNNERTVMNRINGMLGAAMVTHGQAEPQPLTTILGMPVKRPEPVKVEQLTPTIDEVAIFKAKRDELYNDFPKENKDVFAIAKEDGGESKLRAVAKKAGINAYADAKIDDKFINKIRDGINKGKQSVSE